MCKYFRGFYFMILAQKNNQKNQKDDKKVLTGDKKRCII